MRKSETRIVYNRLLLSWFIVRGPHDTPLTGAFDTRQDAALWLARRNRPLSREDIAARQADAPHRSDAFWP